MPSDQTDLDALIREHREAAQFAVTTENHKDGALEDLVAAEAALRARLSELRARADELEKCRAKWRMEWRAELRARRAAERALAECRAKTIEECAAFVDEELNRRTLHIPAREIAAAIRADEGPK